MKRLCHVFDSPPATHQQPTSILPAAYQQPTSSLLAAHQLPTSSLSNAFQYPIETLPHSFSITAANIHICYRGQFGMLCVCDACIPMFCQSCYHASVLSFDSMFIISHSMLYYRLVYRTLFYSIIILLTCPFTCPRLIATH